MNLTDTHCHLADPALQTDSAAVIRAAQEQGVTRFIVPATCRSDWPAVAALAEGPSEHAAVYIAFGIHPWFAEDAAEDDFKELETRLRQHPQAWLGEIGLDFYAQKPTAEQRARQTEVFVRQLELAERLRRRVIIHNLKATAAVAAAVKQAGFTCGGTVHAFSGSLEEAEILIGQGFYIGIGSLLLNPTAKKVRLAAAHLPLDKIVLETDSPFMLKNEVNTPANVRKIAEIVAELREEDVAEVARQTEENVNELLARQAVRTA